MINRILSDTCILYEDFLDTEEILEIQNTNIIFNSLVKLCFGGTARENRYQNGSKNM